MGNFAELKRVFLYFFYNGENSISENTSNARPMLEAPALARTSTTMTCEQHT